MQWKHDLIARVNARVHAAPIELPPTSRLTSAAPGALDYLRVRISGDYSPSQTALVRAATELGTGYWAMTPMRLADSRTVWINRGFVPEGTPLRAVQEGVPTAPAEVVGLLRASEPGGSLLQSNRPREDRWYSRDVAALSLAKGAGAAPPVFIDVQREDGNRPAGGKSPVPGLTVIRFPDNHLSYALTWFAMAALSAVGIGLVWRRSRPTMP